MKLRTAFILFCMSLLCCFPLVSAAQDVVRYDPVKLSFWTADDVAMSLSRQSENYLLTLTLNSEERRFLPETTLWMRTFDDELLQLRGSLVDNEVILSAKDQETSGFPKRRVVATAIFPITRGQLNLLQRGVKQLRLSTIPMTYDVRFSRDRVGERLYKLFLQQEEVM